MVLFIMIGNGKNNLVRVCSGKLGFDIKSEGDVQHIKCTS